MMLANWIAVAGVVAELLAAGAIVGLAWRVFKFTRQSEGINQLNAALASINQLNATALSSNENLQAIDRLFDDGRDTSLESARKRWAAFLALQTHQQIFLAWDSGYIPADVVETDHKQVLDLLLRDPDVLSLANGRGFHPLFVQLCNERAQQQSSNTPAQV